MRSSTMLFLALFVLIALPSISSGGDKLLRSTAGDQQSVMVTVYNQDLGLVKDVRALKLPGGIVRIAFEGVASGIDPTSVHIRSLDRPGELAVLEQNFEYDLISPAKLMEKYVGKVVELVTVQEKKEKRTEARLIGIEKGYVYEIEGKIAINPPGRVVLPALPEGLISKPTLMWTLKSDRAEHTVEASYLTSGLSWRADYVAVLSEDDSQVDLSGWVTVENKSGASYREASLKLVAGDVHRVREALLRPGTYQMKAATMAVEEGFEERAFFEYHIYDLGRKTTVRNNQTKQIRLMGATGVSVRKSFVYEPRRRMYFDVMRGVERSTKVGVYLAFANSEENRLGMPLPKGIVRVYKKDEDGALEFLGEDEIDHTPKDETIRIKMGNAFDVVAERTQTDFRKSRNTYQSSYAVRIRNHKDEDIVVSVIEHPRGEWKIRDNNRPYEKESATKVRFDVSVAAGGETELIYTIVVER